MAENPLEIAGKLWKIPGKSMETPRNRWESGYSTNHEFKGIHGKTIADFDLGCGPMVPRIGSVVFVIESRRHKYHMSFHISIHPTLVFQPFPQWEASPLPHCHQSMVQPSLVLRSRIAGWEKVPEKLDSDQINWPKKIDLLII